MIDTSYSENEIQITGPLTQDTVIAALKNSAAGLREGEQVTVNLQAVTDCDSAGLAMIIELIRIARTKQMQLTFINAPTQMRDLALVSGLSAVIDFKNNN